MRLLFMLLPHNYGWFQVDLLCVNQESVKLDANMLTIQELILGYYGTLDDKDFTSLLVFKLYNTTIFLITFNRSSSLFGDDFQDTTPVQDLSLQPLLWTEI